MRKAAILLVIFLLMLLAPVAVRYLQYYRPFSAAREAPPDYSAGGIPPVPTPETGDFQDRPKLSEAAAIGSGNVVLIDRGHDNQFTLEEITSFSSLLAARGFQILPFTQGDLSAALRPAGALVVIAPVSGYSAAEVLAVREFVDRGGRVLLVGDPTRYRIEFDETNIFAPPIIETAQVPLNSLAGAFDITFRSDYLYNTTENEGNFRNILLDKTGFAAGALTDGLNRLVFYSSHSLLLGPSATPLLSGDDNTWSSATDRPGGLVLAALSPTSNVTAGQVLALGDAHFLTEPYNSVYDNGTFAARVADFLAESRNSAEGLESFPYFFRSPVDLAYSGDPDLGPDAFDDIISLQSALRAVGLPLALVGNPDPANDVLHLGLYNQADDVADLLERASIKLVIRPTIQPTPTDGNDEEGEESSNTPPGTRVIESSLGRIEMAGSALVLLDTDGDRQQVVVLAASNDGLESAVDRLHAEPMGGVDLSDCLLQENLAICPTHIDNEPVEYELITTGPPEMDTAPTEEGTPDNRPTDGEPQAQFDATDKGSITVGETKSGELAAEEAHIWTFSDGPAIIDIVVDSGQDMDGIIELYNPENELMANVDSTFADGIEEIRGVEIPDDGAYTILIRDYFNDGGNYELSVTEGEARVPGNRIFIFADDDGEPLDEGVTSAAVLTDLLSADYNVTTWTASTDGPLPDIALDEYNLLIWDSGTYRDEDGLFGEDTGTIIDYLDSGGDIFITGSSPTILGPVELAPLHNLAVVAGDPVLSNGFDDGDTFSLNDVYETALTDITDTGTNEFVFLVRAPEEEGEGAVVGVAGIETNANEQKTVFLFAPFAGLPANVREPLLGNIMRWFDL